jgi:quercetin dioxygenase-like cupin family protein
MEIDRRLLILGTDDPSPRVQRAVESYRTSLRPPTSDSPGLYRAGRGRMQPLLDEVLGHNHVNVVTQDPGARSASHTHDCDQVLVVVKGTAIIETGSEVHELTAGSVLLIPQGTVHVHATSDEEGAETVLFTATGHDTVVLD